MKIKVRGEPLDLSDFEEHSGAVYGKKGRLLLADRNNDQTSPVERDNLIILASKLPLLLKCIHQLADEAKEGAEGQCVQGVSYDTMDMATQLAQEFPLQ